MQIRSGRLRDPLGIIIRSRRIGDRRIPAHETEPFSAAYGGNALFAIPYVTEEGYYCLLIDFSTTADTPASRHPTRSAPSLVAPVILHREQAIGILAVAIIALEAYSYDATLRHSGTLFIKLQCAATYGPDVPAQICAFVVQEVHDDVALAKLTCVVVEWRPQMWAQLGTTRPLRPHRTALALQ